MHVMHAVVGKAHTVARYAPPMSSAPGPVDPPPPQGNWLAGIADAIDEMLWVWDAGSGALLHANPAFERFWRAAAQGLDHGRNALLDRIHPDDRARIASARSQVDR